MAEVQRITAHLWRGWRAAPLGWRIFAALAAGFLLGALLGKDALHVQWLGDLFVRLIRMVVVPLIFVLIAFGIISLRDPQRLGSIGLKAILLFTMTMSIAVIIGFSFGTAIKPGIGLAIPASAALPAAGPSLGEHLQAVVPINPIQALADGQIQAIIFFAALIGVGTLLSGERGKPLADLFDASTTVMLRIVGLIMELAPLGVFGLIAGVVGAQGPMALMSIGKLALCVLLASVTIAFVVHGLLVRCLARLPMRMFFRNIANVALLAFSTASSSATLPAAVAALEERLKVRPSIASTVMPLGATMGMDGAACYLALLTTLAAQAFDVPLTAESYILAGTMIVLLSLGIAPVPSSSLFLLPAVLATVGIDFSQAALISALILPFDRPLDMMRTVPNVTVDLAVATVIARSENEIGETP